MIQLSIVIPAYNAEPYIGELLQSLAEQKGDYFNEFEIVVTDDGSTDKTAEEVETCIKKYPNLHITLLRQMNMGVSAARNYGIEKANGRFCWFVDADDVIADNAMENIIPFLRTFEGDTVMMGEKISFYLNNPNWKEEIKCYPSIGVGRFTDNKEILATVVSHQSILFGRHVIVENRLKYPENIHNNEDCYFIISFMLCCQSAYIDTSWQFYFSCQTDNSLSRSNKKNFRFVDHMTRNSMQVFEMLCKIRPTITDSELLEAFDVWFNSLRKDIVGRLIFSNQNWTFANYYIKRLKLTNYYPYKDTKNNIIYSLSSKSASALLFFSQILRLLDFLKLMSVLKKIIRVFHRN